MDQDKYIYYASLFLVFDFVNGERHIVSDCGGL
jgi:hypothetical protein